MIILWDSKTGKTLRSFGVTRSISVDCSPNEQVLVSLDRDMNIRLWDLDTGKEINSISLRALYKKLEESFDEFEKTYLGVGYSIGTHERKRLAFSPNGKFIAFAFLNKVCFIDSESLLSFDCPTVFRYDQSGGDLARFVAFSPNGRKIAVGGGLGGCIRTLDAVSFQSEAITKDRSTNDWVFTKGGEALIGAGNIIEADDAQQRYFISGQD